MAEDHWRRDREVAVVQMHIRAADAREVDLGDDRARFRLRDRGALQGQGSVEGVEHHASGGRGQSGHGLSLL
jgi:hypothetical protein